MKKLTKAKSLCEKALKLAVEIDVLQEQREACECLADLHEKMGNSTLSLAYYKQFIQFRDSLKNEQNTEQATRLSMQYEYDKQHIADSLEFAKQQEVKDVRIGEQETQKYYLFAGLGFLVIFILFIFNRYRVTNIQKNLIEDQKYLVESKNTEILDSIAYSKRIQHAILPPERHAEEVLGEHFVFYKAKDIVSGDFYWIEGYKDEVTFAAVDCTGHGVPGAFMSIVGYNSLNQALQTGKGVPAKVLDELNKTVSKTLHQSDNVDIKDGMDIAFCALNRKKMTMQYAGAFNSLFVISSYANVHNNNDVILIKEIEGRYLFEIKADRFSIGSLLQGGNKKYTNHELQLDKGDMIYIATDGYFDQFGGPDDKKFMPARFRELLFEIDSLDMDLQRATLEHNLSKWQGDNEQVDDICVIGLRV